MRSGVYILSYCFLRKETSYFPTHLPRCINDKKPIARLIGQLRRVLLLPNISVRQNSPSSGAVKAKLLQLSFVKAKLLGFHLAFTAPDEGEFCLTEILGNKITLLSCPISLAIGFLFYSTLLILIYTKIRLHLATVCASGPCIELPVLMITLQKMLGVALR